MNILALDGGGVKGYYSALLLGHLEKNYNINISSHFDIIIGTSIGSIIAFGLGYRYTANEISNIIKTKSQDIFQKNMFGGLFKSKYSSEGLKKTLKKLFLTSKIREVNTKVMCTAYDLKTRSPIIFKSWKEDQCNISIVDVCLASAAAPGFFQPHNNYVDGGVFMNNPALIGLTEGNKLKSKNEKINLLSLGTTNFEEEIKIKNGGPLEWLRCIIDIFMDNNTDSIDYIIEPNFPDINYLRLQENSTLKIDMDDFSEYTFRRLETLSNITIFKKEVDIIKFLELSKKNT